MINEDSLFRAMIDAAKTHHVIVSNIKWSNGITYCFLFDGMWFPLRATINHARRLQGLPDNANKNQCEGDLRTLLDPLNPVIEQILLTANQLTQATFAYQIEGRKRKWEAINSLNVKQQLIQGYA
jgi:hypothetical protein